MKSFFFLSVYEFFGCAGSLLLLHGLFSSCGEQGLLSSCSAQASRCDSFPCCGAQALGHVGFSSCGSWAQYLWLQALEHRLSCGARA